MFGDPGSVRELKIVSYRISGKVTGVPILPSRLKEEGDYRQVVRWWGVFFGRITENDL